MWARLGPPFARLLALAAIILAVPTLRSFYRTDRIAIATSGMLVTNPVSTTSLTSTLTGLNGWALIEVDRGNVVLGALNGPAHEFTFAPSELWFTDATAHWSSHKLASSQRSPPLMHKTIGGQGFGLCFWVSWPMKQPPRTIGSTYLFTTSGPDFQIALPLLLLVPLMALPFVIMTWQRWNRRRPRGFDVDLTPQPEQA